MCIHWKWPTLLAVIVVSVLVTALPAPAGYLLLSGDVNIINPLVSPNGGGQAIHAGNQRFFQNVLGSGDTVLVQGPVGGAGSGGNVASELNSFYNGIGGVSSSVLSGPITAASLVGVELFVSIIPTTAYTSLELAVLGNFLNSGGSVFLIGENSNFPNENLRINNALTALGSGMQISNTLFDSGFNTATGPQIGSHSLTTGVASFRYAAPSEISVTGGTVLFRGSGLQPFVAVESRGPEPVPVPGGGVLFGIGLVCLGVTRLRFRAETATAPTVN